MSSCLAQGGEGERGAVFVEKLIAYLPLLIAFFAAWELAELAAARLVVQRASSAAGRAAAVVLADDPIFYEGEPVGSFDGARRADIELAAGMVLSSLPRLNADFEVDIADTLSLTGLGAPLEVTVSAHYECSTLSLFCAGGDTIPLTATTTHAYQGAKYQYAAPSAAVSGASAALVASHAGFRSSSRSPSPGPSGAATSNQNDCDRPEKPCRTEPRTNAPGPKAQCRYLYRSDGRAPAKVFNEGMPVWGSERDIFAHVEGSRMRESAYTATTYDEKTAYILYWQTNKSARQNRCIYKIRDCGCGFDVRDELNKCRSKLSPAEQERVDRYAYQKEIVIAGGVRAEDIESVTCPNPADEPPPAEYPGNSPTPPKKPPEPTNMYERLRYKSKLAKYEREMEKYRKAKEEYDRKLEAFKNWPPADSVKVGGNKPIPNPHYEPNDDVRRNRPCE